MAHAEFLELVLADEVTRRDTTSADLRARAAGLDPAMRLENWDDTAEISYDRPSSTSCSRCVSSTTPQRPDHRPGRRRQDISRHRARPRRRPPALQRHFERADQLLKRLKASRLDNSHDGEIRKLLRVDLLILDDFCLQPLDATDTADIYEIIVERHRRRPRSSPRTASQSSGWP